jgi:hypothetical protein
MLLLLVQAPISVSLIVFGIATWRGHDNRRVLMLILKWQLAYFSAGLGSSLLAK